MSTSFTRTREQLAAMVLRKVRVLAAGATAVSVDTDVIYEAMDLRLKEMHRLGTFWRKVTSVPVTFSLTGGIISASAGAGDILFPLKMTWLDVSQDEPIDIISIPTYAAITDKTRTGTPRKALWKGGTEFIFYPIPDVNSVAKLTYEKIADDTTAGAAPDIEVSMMRWMKDILVFDVADDYGVPEARMARLTKEAARAEIMIRKLNAPRVQYGPVAVDDFDGRGAGGIGSSQGDYLTTDDYDNITTERT